MLKKQLIIFSLMLVCVFANAQRLSNKYTYSNLKGVSRFGFYIPLQSDWQESFAVDYIKVLGRKNYTKYSFNYLNLENNNEKSTKIYLNYDYGNHLATWMKSIYIRGLIGPELGYEWKKSKIIDADEKFIFIGARIGLDCEIFLTKNILIPISITQNAHYYLKNIRTRTQISSGIRLTF